jgi:glycosyltransferase involved in cell wall biosynthesis
MGQDSPLFSIIIPTYNRPRQLTECLQALAQLDYPRDRFEVVIVDDEGTALLGPIVSSFIDRLRVTLLAQPHSGPATARNLGVARAQGRYMVFTDDDCTPAVDWLRALETHLLASPEDAVVGLTVNALTHNPYAVASQHLISFLLAYHRVDANHVRFWTTSNLTLPAEKFRLVGGFDATFPFPGGEDSELCLRWLAQGFHIRHAPAVRVFHAHHMNFRTFCWQHFRYGRGASRLRHVAMRRGYKRRQRQPLTFALRLSQHLSACERKGRKLGAASLLALALAIEITGAMWEHVVARRPRMNQPSSPKKVNNCSIK